MANLAALRGAWEIALAVIVALGVYLLAVREVVGVWRVMPPALDRLVSIKQFLGHQAETDSAGAVYLLGSSVLMEGIDCGPIDELLPDGRQAYNLSWSGAGPRQWLLMVPSLVAAKPALVVFCTDLLTATEPPPILIPDARLDIANWWEFIPPADMQRLRPLFTDHEAALLTAPAVRVLLDFRVLPPGALDAYVREVSRPELRYEGFSTNFKAPWVRRHVVPPAAMEFLLLQKQQVFESCGTAGLSTTMPAFTAIVNYLRDAGSQVLVVVSPIHPAFAESLEGGLLSEMRRELSDMAAETGAGYVDHSRLLSADQYADPVHPFGPGRRVWSIALAEAMIQQLDARE